MLKEIGSNFWVEPNSIKKNSVEITPSVFGIDGDDYCWLSTGRSAISLAIKNIEHRFQNLNKVAIVPPFTCETVIDSFVNLGYKIIPYELDKSLNIKNDKLIDLIKENAASILLIHRYFGFDTILDSNQLFKIIHSMGVQIIEDKTQCLYSNIEHIDADFWVGSIRKWHGVPDGGFIVSKNGAIINKPTKCNKKLEEAKLDASYLKYNYMFCNNGEKSVFLNKYKIAEDVLDSQTTNYTINESSYYLQANLDIKDLSCRRRNNYLVLVNGLSKIKGIEIVFPSLEKNVVPLYCPIIVNDREKFQKFLRDAQIYAPIIWPRADNLPEVCLEVNIFYDKMLSIPIDQRYSNDDMIRIVKTIEKYMEDNHNE